MLVPAFVVHGILAVLIILVILAIVVLGVISLLRLIGRGAKKAVDTVEDASHRRQ